MSLTFENFKSELPAKILERGRVYVRDGNVADLEMDEEGHWLAQVTGTEDYEVEIEQQPDGSLTCSCTCPYEHGEYCKHVAAVLYAIEEAFPDQVKSRQRKTRIPKRENPKDKLQEALKKALPQELITTLLDLAKQDKRIANQLMIRFGAVKADKTNYGKLIKDTLRAHMDHGFLDYQGVRRAGRAVLDLLAQADQMLEQGQWDSAVAYYRAVIDNITAVMERSDDSDGVLGEVAAAAVDSLERAATHATEEQEAELFALCLQDAQSPTLVGWDWRWDLFQIAADLVSMPDQRQQLFAVLDQYQPATKGNRDTPRLLSDLGIAFIDSTFMSSFDAERAAAIKLSVIERLDGSQAVEKFMNDNLKLDSLRQMLIERMIQRGNFAQAKQLTLDGITNSQKRGLPGLVIQYQSSLFDIARHEKDAPTIIRIAREHLLSGRGLHYYDILKETVPASEWAAFTDALIKDSQKQSFMFIVQPLPLFICAKEGRWQDILNMAKTQGWTMQLEPYRQELEKRFPTELAALYEKTVYHMLEPVTGRDTYRAACDYLLRIKALGHAKRAIEIVEELKLMYPKRRSMLEELKRF